MDRDPSGPSRPDPQRPKVAVSTDDPGTRRGPTPVTEVLRRDPEVRRVTGEGVRWGCPPRRTRLQRVAGRLLPLSRSPGTGPGSDRTPLPHRPRLHEGARPCSLPVMPVGSERSTRVRRSADSDSCWLSVRPLVDGTGRGSSLPEQGLSHGAVHTTVGPRNVVLEAFRGMLGGPSVSGGRVVLMDSSSLRSHRVCSTVVHTQGDPTVTVVQTGFGVTGVDVLPP